MQANMHKAGFWPTRSLSLRLTDAEVRDLAALDLLKPLAGPMNANLVLCGVVGMCREVVAIWDRQPSPSRERSPLRDAYESRTLGSVRSLWRRIVGAR